MDTFAKRIVKLRKSLGLSQTELAERLKIGRSTIAMWETGERTPDVKTINRLAVFFDTSTAWLVSGNEASLDALPDEQANFLKAVEEGLGDVFFYDFDKSSEEMQEEAIETLRMVMELQKKRQEKRKQKE